MDSRIHYRKYEYDANGNEKKLTLSSPAITPIPPPIQLDRNFDFMNRLTMVEAVGKQPTRYYYDTLGRRRIVEDALGNRTITDYDGAGRVQKVEREMWANGRRRDRGASTDNWKLPSMVTFFSYDENGNLLTVSDDSGVQAVTRTFRSQRRENYYHAA